ncbi:MAG: hypothetical protein AAB414_00820 [Patescibacteria group bacterium]
MKIKLEGLNFLKVYDVLLDIQDKLQLSATNDITIDLFPSRIRFPKLFPEDTPFSKERYCQDRLEAINYLKEIGAISAYQLYKAHFNTWEDKVRIVVNKEMFDKAQKQLNSIHKRMEKNKDNDEAIEAPVTDNITWPDNFKWIDENTYDLAGEGRITFMAKEDNKTKTYFKKMTDEKDWVKVVDMAGLTGENAGQVRTKLNQIKAKIRNKGYSHLITVESKGDYFGGAYRLHPYPKRNV